jgi:hypothetical protein
MRGKKNLLVSVALVLSLALAGCGGSGSSSGGGGGGGGVGSAGGTVSMNGVAMVIPTGAVDTEGAVSPTFTMEDTLPAPVPAGASVASKTVVISGVTYNFISPVLVTIPYTTVDLGTDDVPAVFFYNPDTAQYSLVGVKSIDTTAKTITFSTSHGGKFVALGFKGLGTQLGIVGNVTKQSKVTGKNVAAAVDSGFVPAVDGFFHPNFGAFDSPGGCCLGMANLSVWYFSAAKAGNSGTGLYSMYKEGDLTRWEDDLTARELISRAFMASSQAWAQSWMQKEYKLDAQVTGYMMMLALKLSGPMVFLMADQMPGFSAGHAAVVYKYDAGKFYVYDDNFPAEVVTIDWGTDANGKYQFTNYTKNAAYNPKFTQFSFEGYATFAESSQYKQLYDGAQSGWSASNSKFNTLGITSATDSQSKALAVAADGSIALTQADTVKIQGTVSGGIKTAKYVFYRLNGGQRTRVDVTGGTFTVNLPQITLGTNTLMLVATDDKFNEWNAYGGFKEVAIKIKGSLFFENGGFESLTVFDKWFVESHTWQNTVPGSFTPGKSDIVTSGPDPIATTINKVYVGNQSLRINNSDNDYHISSASQSAIVPNAANPQAKFYWAAVLEDPSHPPADQPYVDVTVIDENTATTLYSKHFYSNDPSYPGWLLFNGGNWKAIPWQTITLGFTRADAGHKITIKVTAADCAQGGHGGYVYLDGDE